MQRKCCRRCASDLAEIPASLRIHALSGIALVQPGDDLAALIGEALSRADTGPADGDVLVVAQKIVSKAEGRLVDLRDVEPSGAAIELARETDKDPRMVELILRESTRVVRKAPGVIIVRHRLGLVSANAGIDQSNIEHGTGEFALLLPQVRSASGNLWNTIVHQMTGFFS